MHFTYIIQLLLSNALNVRKDKSILYSRISIIALFSTFIISINNISTTSLATGVALYGGLLQIDALNQVLQSFIYIISALIIVITAFYPNKFSDYSMFTLEYIKKLFSSKTKNSDNINIKYYIGESYKISEYPLILIFIIGGALLLTSSNDTITIFLSIELQSYGLYLLATIHRNSESSTGAGLTYFLLGSLSSCFILLAIALLYINTGTTSLEGFYIINNLESIKFLNNVAEISPNSIDYILILLLTGFFFKISAAPFHFWSPDVYDAIPTVVTTFVAILAKISILILLLEVVHYASFYLHLESINGYNSSNSTYSTIHVNSYAQYSILLSSTLSLIIGTVLGLNQSRIKRLYAYSTISHLGFILLALSINSLESTQAFIFYLVQYSSTNLNAFLLLIAIGWVYMINTSKSDASNIKHRYNDRDNSPIQFISQLKGLFHLNSYIAISLAITIYSFTGIPPLIGFFAKQVVLSAALDNGYVFIVLIAVLASVISAVYYLNIIKVMYFEDINKPSYPAFSVENKSNTNLFNTGNEDINNKGFVTISSFVSLIISMITLFITLFILNGNLITILFYILSIYFFNP
jgi:NADH-ubiquinone oxidoreductase chain 2